MSGGAALWGAGAALTWGVSDYTARFAGERAGVATATFGMMLIGLVITAVYVAISGEQIHWSLAGAAYIVGGGIGIAVGTAVLFEALTKGPVSIASPMVACYPALSVPITVALGARPGVWEWVAMGGTIAGIWLVARYVKESPAAGDETFSRANIRRTALLALSSAVIFALAINGLDLAVVEYGPTITVLGIRIVGVLCFVAWFLIRREVPRAPVNSWWIIGLIGVLDTAGHFFLYLGLDAEHGEFAVVASAAYTVVTVLLARIFLKEPVSPPQWLGIAVVVGGIASLALLG